MSLELLASEYTSKVLSCTGQCGPLERVILLEDRVRDVTLMAQPL